MKRLARLIFNASAATSLILLIAIALLTIRSFRSYDDFNWYKSFRAPDTQLYHYDSSGLHISQGGVRYFAANIIQTTDPFPNKANSPDRSFQWHVYPKQANYPYVNLPHNLSPFAKDLRRWDFEFFTNYFPPNKTVSCYGEWDLVFPLPAIMLFLAITPTIWTTKKLRRRRPFDKTHCQSCGYDLRATPTRCPECGKANN